MYTFNNDIDKLAFLKKYKLASRLAVTIPTFYHYTDSSAKVPSLCEVIGYEEIYDNWAMMCIKVNEQIINIHSSYLLEMQKRGKDYIKNNSSTNTEESVVSSDSSKSYIVFDIETTGFNRKKDEIIEIAAIKHSGNDINEFHEYVNIDSIIPLNISLLTTITNETLQDADTIDIVLPKFLSFIKDTLLIGHNIQSFDIPFLNTFCLKLGLPCIENDTIDTLPLAKAKLPRLENYKLKTICEYYDIDTSNAHQALEDCYLCDNIYSILSSNTIDKNIEIKTASNPFQEKILSILEKIIQEKELPDNSLRLRENKNKYADSYSILISEPPYPVGSERLGGEQSILKVSLKSDFYTVDISEDVFKNIPCPDGIKYRPAPKIGNTTPHILLSFENKDNNLYSYIESAILYKLSIYHTSEPTFGCCNRFNECSDAKKCVHENKLYSTACTYRKNLEDNRIFYGKNRNID